MAEDSDMIAQFIRKRIVSVTGDKDAGRLMCHMQLDNGGVLTACISSDSANFHIMVNRRPHEVCMQWRDPEGGFEYLCDGDPQNERNLSEEMRGKAIEGIETIDDSTRLILDDGAWTPSVHWITPPGLDEWPLIIGFHYKPPTE